MIERSQLPKTQHYVPRMLLKNFCAKKKSQIHVFDKTSSAEFATNIKNVAAEHAFYNLETENDFISLEPTFQSMETKCDSLLGRILREESLASLNDDERVLLATFVAAQHLRTAQVRNSTIEFGKQMHAELLRRGIPPEDLEPHRLLDEEAARAVFLAMIQDVAEYVPHYLTKKWLLLRGNRKNPFYISDNPVALRNRRPAEPGFSNLGIALPGIEIYLPLSSTIVLAMYCPDEVVQLREGYARSSARRLSFLERGLPLPDVEIDEVRRFVAAIDEGSAVECNEDSVTNLNSLQVMFAERQIYCERPNFSLAQLMIATNQAYRKPARGTVS